MKWILIAAFVMTNDGFDYKGGTGYKGFAFQEFDSQKTCEAGKELAEKMAQELNGSAKTATYRSYRLECTPK
jgi:hypothetical protein